MLLSFLLALTGTLAATSAASATDELRWVVGEPAPHVHLPDIRTGKAIDLDQYLGKKVLIAEFASW